MDEWIKQLCVRAAVAGLYAVTEQEAREVGERIAAAAMREQLVEQMTQAAKSSSCFAGAVATGFMTDEQRREILSQFSERHNGDMSRKVCVLSEAVS